MTDSILSVLELVRDSLPPNLIDADGYKRVAAIAEQLPEELTTFWGFECRLGDAAAAADILFETRKESRGQRLLAGRSPSAVDALCQQWPVWQKLRMFAELWAEPTHPFFQAFRNIWLEFDAAAASSLAQAVDAIHQPSVFFGPDQNLVEREQLFRLLSETFAIFEPLNGAEAQRLSTLIATLPEGAQLFQVGCMLSRDHPGVRICVNKLAADAVADWLVNTGWQGDAAAFADILQNVIPMLQTFAVNFNLTAEGVSEKIGLECYMDWLEDRPQQWEPLLDMLQRSNLCLPHKRQGLLDFPGISQTPAQQRLSADGVLYLNLFRKIHHLKLTISDNQIREAKAYIALSRPALDLGKTGDAPLRDSWLVE